MSEPKKKILLTAQANEFIYAQPLPVIGEFLATLKELEAHGNLGLPRAKKIDDNLFEIRIKVARNQYRAFYCYAIGNLIYILSGFVKKTQKTPVHEIRKARQIMKGLGL